MIPVLSRDQVRAVDQHAIATCHVPSTTLMENAGRGAAEIIVARSETKPGTVVIVCGTGNNGGDGFVVARRLAVKGLSVRLFLAGSASSLAGDARANHDAWLGVGGTAHELGEGLGAFDAALSGAAIVVDALLGTGLTRPVTGALAVLIERINRAPGYRIALDLPSGLDANTGHPLGIAVDAHETLTFAHHKLGLLTSSGADFAGQVTVVDIGIPSPASLAVGPSAWLLEPSDVAGWLAPRRRATHKGTAGRVVIVAGSPGKTGAALLAARGALRAGAGLVTLCTFPETADVLDGRVLEEMTARINPHRIEETLREHLNGAQSVVLGPGLGRDERARRVVEHVASEHPGLVVVDADAVTLLSEQLSVLRSAPGPRVLTPHPGELGVLLGTSAKEVEADRFGALSKAVETARCTVLLKGARTLIGAPDALPVVNPSGSPAMATAGSGDVLSGVLSAIGASIHDPQDAACTAAYLHGAAGEAWASAHATDRGLLAHEIADGIPAAIGAVLRSSSTLPR